DAILSAAHCRHGILGLVGGQRPGREAAEAVVEVKGPIAALAELAVADDVDARLGLLAHDRLNRFLETALLGASVIGFAILDLVQERDELRGPDQAAHVGCEDAVGGSGHFAPSRFCLSPFPYHLRVLEEATIARKQDLLRSG